MKQLEKAPLAELVLSVKKYGINGEGIGYYNKKPVFIPGAFANEWARVAIMVDHGRYYSGRLLEITKANNARKKTFYPQLLSCGYPFLSLKYGAQLKAKRELLCESLERYAQVDSKLVKQVIPSEFELGYRNQCKVPFGMQDNQLVSGLFEEKTGVFVPVQDDPIHKLELETVRKQVLRVLNQFKLKAYDTKSKRGLRTLILRSTSNLVQLSIIASEPLKPEVAMALGKIPGICGLSVCVNKDPDGSLLTDKTKLLIPENKVELKLDRYRFLLSPTSFFQLNTYQAKALYRYVRDLVPVGVKTIVEAYCGIGTLSHYLAKKAECVIGIDANQEAIADAKAAAIKNQVEALSFVASDSAAGFKEITKKVDLLVVDPPRSGLDGAMIAAIHHKKPRYLIYVSCNPSTLAKNIADLSEYQILSLQPFDMFPQTPLVECVALMVLK
ncbi:MAG: 23S rRNA (uracil(1939)-C(5))-methyltransferase RlmD [Erysipelotrichaceae bacterium]|nr:23S rRNA (uracil(1939)-C(5))-methyltransferase RlmD [Erysipelotrichaceae bacterium]